jgi:hypothetical protein
MKHELAKQFFTTFNYLLRARGLTLQSGTVFGASTFAAPISTKNNASNRDPEMHKIKISIIGFTKLRSILAQMPTRPSYTHCECRRSVSVKQLASNRIPRYLDWE